MDAKLSSYAQNQLPGGKYWEPESDIASVLESLKPNNNVCESILGLNDYYFINGHAKLASDVKVKSCPSKEQDCAMAR